MSKNDNTSLHQILSRSNITSQKVFLHPDIPNRKLVNAIKKYGQGVKNDDIILLLDDTLFGGASEGLMLTESAILYHETLRDPVIIQFSQIKSIDINKKDVTINDEYKLKSILSPEQFNSIFNILKNYILNDIKYKNDNNITDENNIMDEDNNKLSFDTMKNEIKSLSDDIGKLFRRRDNEEVLSRIFTHYYPELVYSLNKIHDKYDAESFLYFKNYIEYEINNLLSLLLIYTFLKHDSNNPTNKETFNMFVDKYGNEISWYMKNKCRIPDIFVEGKPRWITVEDGYTDKQEFLPNYRANIFKSEYKLTDNENLNDNKIDMTLYGVGFNDSYNQIIDNGLKRGYKISASFIPNEYSNKIIHIDKNNDYTSLQFMKGESNIPGLKINHKDTYNLLNLPFEQNINGYGYNSIVYNVTTGSGNNDINFLIYTNDKGLQKLISIAFDYDPEIEEVYKEKYGPERERKFKFGNDSIYHVYQSNNIFAIINDGKCVIYNPNVIDELSSMLSDLDNKIKLDIEEQRKIKEEEERLLQLQKEKEEKEKAIKRKSEI